ncbi:5-dehydro-4-deoxyglucarate dehydratase [Microbacterium halophytorum]|uniref:5-dehydro-4-deoxyglucarate dehydratase n=1 Tax=Microbacterium halophytorum TaxID=2067568 RepID=UPI000CFD5232|nr:5-dehydro-4-deoxyglucarate dehydratase [Microbacterium halophytorum]
MTNFTPAELAEHLKDGLLSFPATAFTPDFEVDEATYRDHVAWQASYDVHGLFAAGGTGEGFSLSPEENARVVRAAVESARAEVPVLGSAGGWTKNAVANAQAAEEAGAAGLLVLPPYLTECSQEGLVAHVGAIAEATELPLIVYNRANAIYSADTVATLADRYESFIGFKDAIGNIEHLAKVTAKAGDRLFYLGGLPTAETYALPLLQMGMSTYSSAMFNFAPEFALEFYADVRAQDRAAVTAKLKSFVLPYLDIRDRGQGFGVSIVKAGLEVIGRPVGPVRAPLKNLSPQDIADLRGLMSAAGIARA